MPASPVASVSATRDNSNSVGSTTKFDVSKNLPLVPLFRELKVDSYFRVFERITTSLGWPQAVWSLMLQCKLEGKAMEVYSTLSIEEALQNETIKAAILRVYELVPEAFRQKFRNHKKVSTETFVDFAREKGILFDKWRTSSISY